MDERVFIGDDGQHPLQAVVGELDYGAAPDAYQVLVALLRRGGLVPLEALAEVVSPHQSAGSEKFLCSIHGGGPYPVIAFRQGSLNIGRRRVRLGADDYPGDTGTLSGAGKPVILKVLPEAVYQIGPLTRAHPSHLRRPLRDTMP